MEGWGRGGGGKWKPPRINVLFTLRNTSHTARNQHGLFNKTVTTDFGTCFILFILFHSSNMLASYTSLMEYFQYNAENCTVELLPLSCSQFSESVDGGISSRCFVYSKLLTHPPFLPRPCLITRPQQNVKFCTKMAHKMSTTAVQRWKGHEKPEYRIRQANSLYRLFSSPVSRLCFTSNTNLTFLVQFEDARLNHSINH